MGKEMVRLKEVVYTLSPNHVYVMRGLWKDIPGKLKEKIENSWQNALFLITPAVGIYWYCEDFKEKEKLKHRY
ncbi:hypothetical protein GOP47_0018823 [Adiantum capillus-veneris]|uniref:Cytochrome b-c1 complex subunit 8 n=1 Tax=Adiantum capillus-veneris TaxID=13818 RepID=A0A9D4UDX5_ADICA|nr:hypothetical protein GOP47_0018823 [Adiantum capillus-veneris]